MATALQDDDATRVTLEAWLVTDVGVVRDHNEDSAFMEAGSGFFIVADGMGGHAAGEVASAMAVETVKKTLELSRPEIDAFKKQPSDSGRRTLVQLLQNAVLQAHQAVYQRGQAEPDKAGMGTTLDVVVVAGPEAFVAHVGDSRTYLIRDGRTSQITTDHTVAEVLVIEGKLTIEEAQVSPLRTILVNAIGVSADVGVEMAHVTLKRGDRLLLCSDGLHDYFPAEDEIAQRLSEDKPGDALKEMVELAKTRGGHDNITGVAVQVVEVINAVPSAMESESTDPVDIEGNPFAHDEPTETAFVPGQALVGGAPLTVSESSLRQTQPMRVTDPEARAIGLGDTIPPAVREAAKSDGTPSADISTADTGRMEAAKLAAAARAEETTVENKPVDKAAPNNGPPEMPADPPKADAKSADDKAPDKTIDSPVAPPEALTMPAIPLDKPDDEKK